ncbi:Alpha-1,3-mannosyltransferase CMT1 [Smittium mucronatum]|uniref:Alpha-1,3-mannosyltransferase CMT1 n=1 Tax=Smittium mucronatum TaxID=133383 RepID=A0A1R0H5J7_9FUNG|nr:Alpha-1,3-mannosyltransferase CMT1 [Smittium mucronatum]
MDNTINPPHYATNQLSKYSSDLIEVPALNCSKTEYHDIKKLNRLQKIQLESSFYCLTKSRIKFDRHLERDSRYEYLKGDTNSYVNLKALSYDENKSEEDNNAFKRKYKYFFSMNLYNNEEVLPYLIQELLLLFKFLGGENVFLSIYENGSRDKTKSILKKIIKDLKKFDIKHSVVMENHSRPDEFHRIEYLAKIRNRALDPLVSEKNNGRVYDKIIFMNDIFFCRNDILELIYQSDLQESDFTCPLDFHSAPDSDPPLEFRDSWVARDIEGRKFNGNLGAVSDHAETLLRNQQNLPFQVQCSWNGVAILNPKPFYEENSIRFRRSYAGAGECSASECSLLCNDFWQRGYRRFVVVPEILVFYRLENAVLPDVKYDRAISINQTLDEKVKYVDGPEQIICIGLEAMNAIDPEQPELWINYTTSGTKVT